MYVLVLFNFITKYKLLQKIHRDKVNLGLYLKKGLEYVLNPHLIKDFNHVEISTDFSSAQGS